MTEKEREIKEIKDSLRNALRQEGDLFDISIEENHKCVHIFLQGSNEFDDFILLIGKGHFGKNNKQLLEYLKVLRQASFFGVLYALRGNVRACYAEMRIAIETVCIFLYLLNQNNFDEFVKDLEVMKNFSGQDDRILEERNRINKKVKNKMYKYMSENFPDKSERLRRGKKKIINEFFAHSSALSPENTDKVEEGISVSVFDGKNMRDIFLHRAIKFSLTTICQIYLIICDGLKKERGCDTNQYREKIEGVIDRLRDIIPSTQNT